MKIKYFSSKKFFFFTLLLLTPFFSAHAQQSASDLPSGSTSAVIESKIAEETQENLLQDTSVMAPEIDEKKSSSISDSDVVFTLKRINLRPSEISKPDEFEEILPLSDFDPVINEYLNREITFEDIKKLASRVESQYRKLGYFAIVYTPPQRLENQELTLEILLSRMGDLHVEGNRYFRKSRIRSYWDTDKGELLEYQKLRNQVLLMNENPDRKVKPILRPGTDTGTTDVHLKVEDKFPVHVGFSFDNQGVALTGKERYGFSIRHNNLLTLDDIFQIGTFFGEDFGVLYLNHIIPISSHGTRLIYGFTHSQVNPKAEFSNLGINGLSQTYSLSLRQRMFRTEHVTGETYIGIDFKDRRTRVLSTTSVWDRLRVLSAGLDFQGRYRTALWRMNHDFYFGLPLHGDGFPLTSRGAETQFFKYRFGASTRKMVFRGTNLFASFKTQLSPDKLVPQEQMFLGGSETVRGYPESDYGADQALLTRLELNAPIYGMPDRISIPLDDAPLNQRIRFLAFLDYGYGRVRDASAQESQTRNMMGTGVGFEFRFRENVTGRIEWGFPLLEDPITESADSQVHFSFKTTI